MNAVTRISNTARKAQLAASKYVPKRVSRQVGRAAVVAQKHSPEALFAAGCVGVVATAVTASRATLKLDDVLSDHEQKMKDIEEVHSMHRDDYTDSDYIRDKAIVKTRIVTDIAKLYSLPMSIGIVTVGCFAGGQIILNKRNAALMVAYAGLEKGFNEYRDRVIAELGADQDEKFRFESRKEIVKDEAGNDTKKTIDVAEHFKGHSIYSKFFDEYSKSWEPNAEYNRIFLQCQQTYANDMLRARGHLFLNEVYDMLGLERTKAGAVVGWIWGKGGDNYVDFGIFGENEDRIRDFVNGRESSILLDFNVDGVIYDKI